MSIILTLNFDKKIDGPDWYSGWWTQTLFDYIYAAQSGAGIVPDTLRDLAKYFRIKIQPLLKMGGSDLSLEEYGGNKELYEKGKKYNQSCWQNPQKLIDCLKVFVEKIDNDPEVFSQLNVKDDYFLQGDFKKDLIDIIRILELAKENGIKKVRLEAG